MRYAIGSLVLVMTAGWMTLAPVRAQEGAPAGGATSAAAEPDGRFTMTPVEGGVMRLDTRTGALSRCGARGGTWVCELLPDDRSAYEVEIGRLNDRIAMLERQIARGAPRPPAGVPDIMEDPRRSPDGGERAGPPSGPDAGASTEDSDVRREIDRGMDVAEQMFRRFMQMIERLRRESDTL
ncbi:hypothetical protein [Ancylobacter terrae]|uniref:hypothetical protein n=1 Tax=Ancylobacter sp. sgz301288 TaxID=3342077 RepID=UPI00385AC0C8